MTLYPNPYNRGFAPLYPGDPIPHAIRQLERQLGPMKLVKPADFPEEDERTLHPEGTYKATVVGAVAKKSRAGNDMIELTLKTEKGKLIHRLTLIPTKGYSVKRFYKDLATIQIGEDMVAAVDDWDELALACVKAQVLIAVGHKVSTTDGNTYDTVTSFDAIPDTSPGTEPF